MKPDLRIEETEATPGIILCGGTNEFQVYGRSIPENTNQFYAPVLEWLTEYIKSPNDNTEFVFKLDYFNSSSAKKIMEILILLEKIKEAGRKINAIWYYSKADKLIQERGEEMKEITDIPFELKTY